MSMYSRILSGSFSWEKADPKQKLEAMAQLPTDDSRLEQLALHDADNQVRHKAIETLQGETLWHLIGAVRPEDEACLAASLGQHCGLDVIASDDRMATLMSAPPSFRIALIAHVTQEKMATALARSLDEDTQRVEVVRGKGLIDARAAAASAMWSIELLEALALEYRDKQRRLYRAARDRADELMSAREVRRHALNLCERLQGMLANNEVSLTALTNLERECRSMAPSSAQDIEQFAALQARYAALLEQARPLVQEQGEIWRHLERLKLALADLATRSQADAAIEPEVLATLTEEREATAASLSNAAFAALPKDRNLLVESIGRLAERHAIIATESKALINARRLVEELRANPAALTSSWQTEFASSASILRPSLRVPIEETVTGLRAAIDVAKRQQIEGLRAHEQQFRGEIEALVKQMEQFLDKGQHQQANDVATVFEEKRASGPGSRPLPPALEFRVKRCKDRLAKMNEWKRFGDVQAREALCREAEALAKRVTRQEKSGSTQEEAAAFPWPVSAPADAGAGESLPRTLFSESQASQESVASTDSSAQAAAELPRNEAIPAIDIADEPQAIEPAAAPASAEHAESPAHLKRVHGPTQAGPTLPALTPEDIALAVRDLQSRWDKLNKGHGASSKGLWERFRRACDRAYAPARKHFEELEKRRSENAEKKNAVLEKIATLNERVVDGAEWGRILSERGELVRAWFEAGALPRKNARPMQKRFDTLTAEIDAKLDARRAAERARRRALIDQAKVIAEKPADGASMAAMIALQRQWQEGMKGAIRLKAKEDQAMWEEFRAGGSALFGKRDAEKASRTAERDAQLADRHKLLEEIQALASGDDAAVIKRGLEDLGAHWHAMEWPDRKPLRDWEQKFSTARVKVNARLAAIRGEAEKQKRAAAVASLALVENAEELLNNGGAPDLEAIRSALQAILAEGEKLDATVTRRLAALESAIKMGPEAWRAQVQKTQAERDGLLLELEIVLELSSPPELQAERRMRMLRRLAESKNSRATPPLMAPDVPKAIEKLLALPLAMQGARARVEAVIEAARRKA